MASDDKINHPVHYGGDVPFEAIKLIEDWGFSYGFCMGSAVKYTVRAGAKDGESEEADLDKAIWYLDRTTAAPIVPAPSPKPAFFRLAPHRAAAFHQLDEHRTAALASIAQRDPETAIRILMGSR